MLILLFTLYWYVWYAKNDFASWFIESNLVTYSICTDGQMRLVGGSSQHQEIVERHSLFL